MEKRKPGRPCIYPADEKRMHLGVMVRADIYKTISSFAREEGISTSELVRQCLEKYLPNMEEPRRQLVR